MPFPQRVRSLFLRHWSRPSPQHTRTPQRVRVENSMGNVLNPALRRRPRPPGFPPLTLKTSFNTPDVYQLPTQASRPHASDKARWFPDWRLHELPEYDVKSHLPKFIKPEQIQVKVAGYVLEDCVTYDACDAMIRYVDPRTRAQGVVAVSVRAPNFELDDIFLAFNGYKSTPFTTQDLPRDLPEDLRGGIDLGYTFCVTSDLKDGEGKGKPNANSSKTESDITSDVVFPLLSVPTVAVGNEPGDSLWPWPFGYMVQLDRA